MVIDVHVYTLSRLKWISGCNIIFRVVVRGRKDAGAVRAAVEAFMPGLGVEVESLGGVRGGRLVEELEARMKPFTLVLLGGEDAWVLEEVEAKPFTEVLVTRARKVRNNPVSVINGYLSRARASMRLSASWDGEGFILAKGAGDPLVDAPIDPRGDSFLIYGQGSRILSMFLVRRIPGAALLYKAGGGKHLIYAGPRPMGEAIFQSSYGPPKARAYPGSPRVGIDMDRLVEKNRRILEVLERHSMELLRENAGEPDTVIVPWSGGKDSTAALILAVKTFGRDRVKAVYVDTGIDFPENLEYVERVASLLGVDYIVKRAGVDEGLLVEEMPMPDPDFRWCTGRKLDALREGFREAARGYTIVVTGDRDAESERRARRPLVRPDERLGYPVISPLKMWSGAHVQLYILSSGAPLNPLYTKGFYRIGCYICFALRGWELEVMRKAGIYERIARSRPSHKLILDRFIELKRKGLGGELGDCICGA